MEAITDKLDNLTTESRERLQQCEELIFREVAAGNLLPSQVALLLAKRFTGSHVEPYGYPTLCLIDLMLQKVLAAGQKKANISDESDTRMLRSDDCTVAGTIARAVLRELWPIFEDSSHGLLMEYSKSIKRKATQEKGIRLVKRWKERYSLALRCFSEEEEKGDPMKEHCSRVKKEERRNSSSLHERRSEGTAKDDSSASMWEHVWCVMLERMEGRTSSILFPPESVESIPGASASASFIETPVIVSTSMKCKTLSPPNGSLASEMTSPMHSSPEREGLTLTEVTNGKGSDLSSLHVASFSSASPASSSSSRYSTAVSSLSSWKKGELHRCRLLLQECLRLLESLPLNRARVYASLLLQENAHHLRPPSLSILTSSRLHSGVKEEVKTTDFSSASSISFLLQLCNTLQNEVNSKHVPEHDSGIHIPSTQCSTIEEREKTEKKVRKGVQVVQQSTAFSSVSSSRHPGASHRETFSKLLELLQQEQDRSNANNVAGENSHALSRENSFSFSTGRVIRYTRPLWNDIALRLPLGQRMTVTGGRGNKNSANTTNGGHGLLFQTAPSRSYMSISVKGGKSSALSYYYPKAAVSATSTSAAAVFSRPFRVPAAVLQALPNGKATRVPFPSVSEWVDNRDMAELAQYDNRIRVGNNVVESVGRGSEDWRAGGKRPRGSEDD